MNKPEKAKLIVTSHNGVAEHLHNRDIKLIVSVGYGFLPAIIVSDKQKNDRDLAISGSGVPRIYASKKPNEMVEWEDKEEVFSRVHAIWKDGGIVLFHCVEGVKQSPTFAAICLAEYYGAGREDEAIRQANLGRPDSHILWPLVATLKDDKVAVFFAERYVAEQNALNELLDFRNQQQAEMVVRKNPKATGIQRLPSSSLA